MIRIVKDAYIIDMNATDKIPIKLPMVPSSGTYKETEEHTESGVLRTIEFGCRLRNRVPGLDKNLAVIIDFADGRRIFFGTTDLPVHLKTEIESLIKISCKYKTIGD